MKNLIALMIGIFSVVIISSFAYAEDVKVGMLNKRNDGAKMVYSEDITRIGVGSTVTWTPDSKGHNVEFIAGPEGFEKPKKSKLNKEYSFTFEYLVCICISVHHTKVWVWLH